jgi:pSer/pThr/pTyr-binding forkhead associated (FHA) protein
MVGWKHSDFLIQMIRPGTVSAQSEEAVFMKVTLLVRALKKHVVVENEVVIGRDKDCDRRVLSSNVSRKHCRLVISGSDVGVRNPLSGNGTQINSQQTESNVDAEVAEAATVEQTPGKIKSLFRMFGKMKNRTSAGNAVPTPGNSKSSEESGNVAVKPLIVAGSAQFDEETDLTKKLLSSTRKTRSLRMKTKWSYLLTKTKDSPTKANISMTTVKKRMSIQASRNS